MFEHFNIELLIVSMANSILGSIIGLGNFTSAEISRANNIVIDVITADIDALSADLAAQESAILESIRNQSEDLTSVAAAQTQVVGAAITAATNAASIDAERNTSTIVGQVSRSAAVVADIVRSERGTLTGQIGQQTSVVTAEIAQLDNKVATGLSAVTGLLDNVIDVLGTGLNTTIVNQIDIDAGLFSELIDQVGVVLGQSNADIGVLLDNLGGIFSGVINSVLDALILTSPVLPDVLVEIKDAILHGKDENTAVLETATDDTGGGFGGVLVAGVLDRIKPGAEQSAADLRRGFVDFINADNCIEGLDVQIQNILNAEAPGGELATTIFDLITAAIGSIMLPIGIGQARAQKWIFDYQALCPNQPLPPAETILALQRNLLNPFTAEENLRKQGWSAEDAEKLINVGFTAPDLGLVYNMFYRGLIDDGAFTQQLLDLGYNESFIAPLKTLAFFIPPVQDLITMAVREVFDPEITAKQGQFEDFPEEFATFAEQQGVSREWAQRYWAAHWTLPSVQMGFEMMHRAVISQDELGDLLRALDVMPFWRQPLIDISFTPFTRVDIRRMHAVDVLTDEEVLRAYKDIGYDDEKAQKLTDFVLEINAPDDILDLDVASDLTRSSIIVFYTDGIINRAAALALLIQAGINLAAAELFLMDADFRMERRERKASVDIILDKFALGGLSLTEASDQISALDLGSRERELALLELERLAVRETKLPSRADLDKFLAGGLIDAEEYLAQLDRLGYPSNWAGRYLALQLQAA